MVRRRHRSRVYPRSALKYAQVGQARLAWTVPDCGVPDQRCITPRSGCGDCLYTFALRYVLHRIRDTEGHYLRCCAWRHARQIFSAVAGMSRCAPAPPGMASATAFMSAEIAAVVPASPAPLTPSGLVFAGTAWVASLNTGRSSARGMA